MFHKAEDFIISEWENVCPNEIKTGVLDIWRIFIPSVPAGKVRKILSVEEKNRAGKYKFEKDQNSFTVSRAVLRLILANYLKAKPLDLKFSYNQFGKPSVETALKRQFFFNLSHSGEFALIAVGVGAEIGIDIEQMKELDYMGLAENFFSRAERVELEGARDDTLKKGFYRLWTRKEAFIKAIGMGLSFPLKEFDVSLNPRRLPHINIHKFQTEFDIGWKIYEINTENQYCASLVIPANKFSKIRAYNFNLNQFEFF